MQESSILNSPCAKPGSWCWNGAWSNKHKDMLKKTECINYCQCSFVVRNIIIELSLL